MDTTSDPTHNMQNPSTMFPYMGTSLIRKCPPLGPYRRPMPMVLGGSKGGGRFLMSEVPLYLPTDTLPPPPSSLPNASSRLTHSSHPPQTSDLPLHPPPLQTHSLHPPTPILWTRVWGSGHRGGPVQRRMSPGLLSGHTPPCKVTAVFSPMKDDQSDSTCGCAPRFWRV